MNITKDSQFLRFYSVPWAYSNNTIFLHSTDKVYVEKHALKIVFVPFSENQTTERLPT